MPEHAITEYVLVLVNGLANQLLDVPLDIIIEHNIFTRDAILRPSQFASLIATYREALPVVTDPSIKRDTPPLIWRASATLNTAYALFIDGLYPNRAACAEPYRDFAGFATAERLYGLWRDAMPAFEPGGEYALVDEYARVLHLERWYEWAPDLATSAQADEQPDAEALEAVTDRELLEEKEPAAVMYCLGALERFDPMPDDQVRAIAFEIALLRRSGLDYASSDQKYTLQSIPGERFSGLQLMCLMYVGFKRIDPSADLEMPLHGAYLTALKLFRRDHSP